MAIARSQMYRQLYGIGNLVKREEYGLGSKIKGALKSVAKAVIPKELDPVLKIAAPFLGPVYGPIAAIAGSARTGKINPLSIALTMAPYLQFGGAGQAGLGSFMPTGYGGAQYGVFGGDYVGLGTQGKSLSSILTDKAKEFLSPTSPNPITSTFKTPTQIDLTGIDDLGQLGYTQGTTIPQVGPDQLTYSTTGTRTNLSGIDDLGQLGYKPGSTIPDQQLGRTAQELQSSMVSGGGITPTETGRSQAELIKTYGTQPGTESGYLELIKKAGSLENIPLSERFSAVQELGGKALRDIYTKPIPGEPGKTQLDKTSIVATLAGAATYLEAKKIADDAGLSDDEFNEEVYQRLKVSPEKEKFTSVLKPEAFGIRNLSATGGRIGFKSGDVVSTNVYRPAKKAYNSIYGYDSNTGDPIYVKDLYDDFSSFLEVFRRSYNKDGGRIGFKSGTKDKKEYYMPKTPLEEEMEGVLSIKLTPTITYPEDKINRENFQVGGMKRDMSNNRMSQIIQLIRDAESVGDFEKAEELRLDLFRETKKAKGGKITYPMGSEIPVRQNQGGITELDLRNKGGFIPVGIKEKADDVPAMLSKNEFVFTADAVRGAGKGSINKGAQKMYKLMKSLEKKVKNKRGN
jgi:hypothetical protein